MKKLFILLSVLIIIVLAVVAGGYLFIQNNPTTKGILAVNKILNAKTPQDVRQIINENQDVINNFKKQGYITDADITKVNQALDKMDQEGKGFNKIEIAETQLKGKIPQNQYDQVIKIISKDNLSIQDKADLAKIIATNKK